MKNSFVIMDSWAVILEGMPEHTTSEVIKMICRYQMNGEVVRSDDAGANALFDAWKPMLDENNTKYEGKRDRAAKAREKKSVEINDDINPEINVDINPEINVDIKDENKVDLSGVSVSVSVKDTVSPNGDNNILSSASDAIKEIIDYLNAKTSKKFSPKTAETKKAISARLKEGYTIDDFKKVIDNKVSDWAGGDMDQYLRPQTLFRPANFESYLNESQKPRPSNKKNAFDAFTQNEYDFDALEKELMANRGAV